MTEQHNLFVHLAPVFDHCGCEKSYRNDGSLTYQWVSNKKIHNGKQILGFIVQYKQNEVLLQVELINFQF